MQILDYFWTGGMEGRPFWIWAEGERVEDGGAVNRRISCQWQLLEKLRKTYTSQATPGYLFIHHVPPIPACLSKIRN